MKKSLENQLYIESQHIRAFKVRAKNPHLGYKTSYSPTNKTLHNSVDIAF